MATSTPNFGWSVPTSSDLVKNGAVAIETLGDSIDASLVDLKGGTTGQILTKATDTDMDFTWSTASAGDITGVTAGTGISGGGTSGTVTVTNSMATAIDAKGDLIAGTGADAFSRLGVGTNDQVLTADSTTATGLKWSTPSGATYTYTTFTPTFTNFTLGNGSLDCRYVEIGKFVHCTIKIVFGSTTSITGRLDIQAPTGASTISTPNNTYVGNTRALDAGVENYSGSILVLSSSVLTPFINTATGTYTTPSNIGTTVPFTWGTSDELQISFIYQRT
jgi:hypothetical protein